MTTTTRFRIGLALEAVGWHPAAWRHSTVAAPGEVFTREHWVSLGRLAADGGIDFVTLEDGLSMQADRFGTAADDDGHRVRGRLDSLVVAGLLLATSEIGEVVVTRNVTHSNPFQVAAQLASLAAVAPGRVVWRPQVSADARDATVVGGAPTPALAPDDIGVPTRTGRRLRGLFQDAEDYVRTVRRLWTTFPADALVGGDTFWRPESIRPLTGADESRYRAAGPLTVPVGNPPPVAMLAHHALEPYRLAAAVADRVFLTPGPAYPMPSVTKAFRQVEELTPDAGPTELYADAGVVLGSTDDDAQRRLAELTETAGSAWKMDTGIFVGTAAGLAEKLKAWRDEHGIAGARLRPAVLPTDAELIVRDLAPLLTAG